MSDVVIYDDGSVALSATVENETVWLARKQISELFDVNVPAISKHIKNIYKSEELSSTATVSKMETVQQEGTRKVKRIREFYNLDLIIAVGYRVNSKRRTQDQRQCPGIAGASGDNFRTGAEGDHHQAGDEYAV